MVIISRQFARPRGLLGRFIGRGMARSNADFSRWVVRELSEQERSGDGPIAEIGSGPGVGLEEALKRFPRSRVWGVDLSPEMASQARSRNRMSVRAGRLSLTVGGVDRLAEIAPIDLVFANHVLYFWHEPEAELRRIRALIRPGGLLGLGYQLKQNMPVMAQRYFPRDGHLLYESDDQVDGVLRGAGFSSISHRVKGPVVAPEGRLAIAIA